MTNTLTNITQDFFVESAEYAFGVDTDVGQNLILKI